MAFLRTSLSFLVIEILIRKIRNRNCQSKHLGR
ncbi:MAG: hypothetical protein JRJ29_02610 [Deltaproteobacteria bacterium]|nr:hypothetical protein [Deltaproteobacteria bacterium]